MDLSAHQKRKKQNGICISYGCSNKIVKGSGKSMCAKHYHRQRKERDPCGYTYHALKSNAKRRGKVFTITMEYFRDWCAETGYIELKGRFAWMYSIDRIEPEKGYEPGNLQMIKVGDNVRKRYVEYFQRQNEVPEDYVPEKVKINNIQNKQEEEPLPW